MSTEEEIIGTDLTILNLIARINRESKTALQDFNKLKIKDIPAFPSRILSVVSRRSGCTQQELALLLERDKAQVARALRELEKDGLITRVAHKSDWRSRCLILTAEGQKIADALNHQRSLLAETMLHNVPDAGKQVLIQLLSQILSDLMTSNVDNASAPGSDAAAQC